MTDTIDNVKNTFSSWDSCMSKAYCKWPVIAGIIVGSLIILSVLICIGRCICCGAECACCCFKCCAGCCGSGRRRRDGHKELDSVPPTPYGRGPVGPGLPMYNNTQYQSAPAPLYQQNAFAQTATFDGKVHEDSLPAMPSWENATSRQVEVIEDVKPVESHELEKLNPVGQQAGGSPSPTVVPGFVAPQAARTAGSDPVSPYGNPTEHDPFLQGQQTTGVMHADSHTGYRGAAPNPAQGVGYGYANHRPGGVQQSPSYNSQSTSDFYSQSGHGEVYEDQRHGGYDRQYNNQSRSGYDREYNDQRQDYDMPYSNDRHNGGGYQNNAPMSPQYSGTTAYDGNQGGYRPFSPAYGGQPARKPMNGSWKDV